MSGITSGVPAAPASSENKSSGTSPIAALADAFARAVAILLNPFDPKRWIKLSAVCVFLGGGASWAAVHWTLTALPTETGVGPTWLQVRLFLASHPLASLTTTLLAVALGIGLIYLRAMSRFILIASIVRGEVELRRAWQEVRPLAGTYFRWLLAALLLMGLALGSGILIALPLLQGGEPRSAFAAIMLATLLALQVSLSVIMALAIALTDDLVNPIVYAERLSLPAAWRRFVGATRGDAGALLLYIFLRFVVSVAAGVAGILLLFPILVTVFSGAVIVAALVVVSLHLVGLDWIWTPGTTLLAAAAVLLLVGLLLAILGAAGMPLQVFLQSFGIRFVAPRVPAVGALWEQQESGSQEE
ncbi:MAG: hypothetical protein ABSG54_11500 [Terriglobia bacterium]